MCFIFHKSREEDNTYDKVHDESPYGWESYNEQQIINPRVDNENYYEEFAGEFISPIMLEEMEKDSDMINNLDNN